MLKIVLCDDNITFLNKLEAKTSSYLSLKELSFNIVKYTSPEVLINNMADKIDIIFLDVQFKNNNGIDIALKLRNLSKNFILIFVSTFIDYAPAGYKVNAFRYILKEQLDLLLDEALSEALYKLGLTRSSFSIKFIGDEYSSAVFTDTVTYIESRLHEVHFHFIDRTDTKYVYATLNSIEEQLGNHSFLRIHQSYLVNLQYFLDAKNYRAKLINNIELPISQKLFSKVKKQLFLYRGKI